MKSTKILVTGAGGFLGYHIAKELLKKEYTVISFSRSNYHKLDALGVTQRLGDLANYEDILLALKDIDAVIHTAGMVGMWGKYQHFYDSNVLGTQNILKAMNERAISKIVYTSTPSVAFGKDDLCGVDESTPYPDTYLTYYAQTKAQAEKAVLEANGQLMATVSLRPHLIFGPGDKNIIPRVLEAQKKGRLKIIGNGDNLVDVLYVENAAIAHINALERLAIGSQIAGKAYFIGQGPVNLWEFTNKILAHAGLPTVTKKVSVKKAYAIGFIIELFLKVFRIYNIHPPMTRYIALQLGKSHYFSHKNSERDLSFTPSISIDEGIERLFKSTDL